MNQVQRAPTRRSACGGFITTGTLIVAALSALVLMTGCHSGPMFAASAHAAPAAGPATATAAPGGVETMPHLVAYDEQFFVPATQEEETTQN